MAVLVWLAICLFVGVARLEGDCDCAMMNDFSKSPLRSHTSTWPLLEGLPRLGRVDKFSVAIPRSVCWQKWLRSHEVVCFCGTYDPFGAIFYAIIALHIDRSNG